MKAVYKQSNKLTVIRSVKHGFFTKIGGVSSGIYESLNCGPSSDDDSNNVIENRQRVMTALEVNQAKLFGLHQIHSTKVYQITSDMDETKYPKGDAIVTTDKNVALSVLGADCTPILFASSNAKVIGAAHAGWKGAVTGIVEAVVEKMCSLGVERNEISACIGPTIHQDSYEVQQDFIDQLKAISTIPADPFLLEKEGQFYFDLPSYLLEQCRQSSIQSESLDLDTYKLENEFFSYRRNTHEGVKDYGRQISVICLT